MQKVVAILRSFLRFLAILGNAPTGLSRLAPFSEYRRWCAVQPSAPTKLATSLRAFFTQHLPLTRGLSPRTVQSYRDTFVLLLRFLAAHQSCAVVHLELQHLSAEN